MSTDVASRLPRVGGSRERSLAAEVAVAIASVALVTAAILQRESGSPIEWLAAAGCVVAAFVVGMRRRARARGSFIGRLVELTIIAMSLAGIGTLIALGIALRGSTL